MLILVRILRVPIFPTYLYNRHKLVSGGISVLEVCWEERYAVCAGTRINIWYCSKYSSLNKELKCTSLSYLSSRHTSGTNILPDASLFALQLYPMLGATTAWYCTRGTNTRMPTPELPNFVYVLVQAPVFQAFRTNQSERLKIARLKASSNRVTAPPCTNQS